MSDGLAVARSLSVAQLEQRRSAPAAAVDPWQLLDPEEAASRLGRSSRSVRQKAKDGLLPSVRLVDKRRVAS